MDKCNPEINVGAQVLGDSISGTTYAAFQNDVTKNIEDDQTKHELINLRHMRWTP